MTVADLFITLRFHFPQIMYTICKALQHTQFSSTPKIMCNSMRAISVHLILFPKYRSKIVAFTRIFPIIFTYIHKPSLKDLHVPNLETPCN